MREEISIAPFIRRLEVIVGAGNDLLRFTSDGSLNHLRITCNIHRTVMGIPNPSTVILYNLSSRTRNAIQKSLSPIVVRAGWANTELHTVFTGNVMACVSTRTGPDILSRLTILQGYNALFQSTVSKTYAGGMAVRDAVADLGRQLPGITVSDTNLKDIPGAIGRGGWSYAGQTKDALTHLAQEHGFSWTINDDALYAVGDKSRFEGLVVLDGDQGGLISTAPILSGPMQVQIGTRARSVHTPRVVPGSTVRIRSSISEGLDGDYKAHTINYSLDTFGDNWWMDVQSFRFL